MFRISALSACLALFLMQACPARAAWNVNGNAICAEPGDQFAGRIVSCVGGYSLVAWADTRYGDSDIYAQRIDGEGEVLWVPDGVPVCTAPGDQDHVVCVPDGDGGIIACWRDFRNGVDYDLYAQRVDSNGVVRWTEQGVPIDTSPEDARYPVIVTDHAGGAIIAWWRQLSLQSSYLYAQRVDSAGAVAWEPAGVPISIQSSLYYPPPCAMSDHPAAGAIIAWQHNGSGSADIYAQRIDPGGSPMWPDSGIAVCTSPTSKGAPDIIADGAGGAIVAWYDWRAMTDIYAQRLGPDGALLWDPDGVPICAVPEHQEMPAVASDGAGGAIIVWHDFRSGVHLDIYAQRVDDAGIVLWATDGVPICTAPEYQQLPQIIEDGAGGAVIAWSDLRNGADYDVYAQRVHHDGSTAWSPDGEPVSAFPEDQKAVTLAPDGAGGAILAWRDGRRGRDDDIYAMRITGGGPPTGVAPDDVRTARPPLLYQNSPNPFNPVTEITYYIPQRAFVTLEVLDVSGRIVRRLICGMREEGRYTVTWNGIDERGGFVASGIYLSRLTAGGESLSRKMVLLR